jgi:fructose-bisphosphate aldolase class II
LLHSDTADLWYRLENIHKMSQGKVQIVLHGTNEFTPEIMAKCIARGVTRVNVNKLVLTEYNEYIEKNTGKVPFTQLIDEGTTAIHKQCEQWIDHLGCTGKA